MVAELLCAAVLSLGMTNADNACHHMSTVVEVADKHGYPPELLVSLIYIESRWTDDAKSWAGACGLTQVVPKWTGGRATGGVKYTCQQLRQSPELSIRVGGQVYSDWLRRYARCRKGRHCSTSKYRVSLCGYNAGYQCKGENPSATGMKYASAVLSRQRKIARKMRLLSR